MSKTINTILSLTDKFTPKLSAAKSEALLFKNQLQNTNSVAKSIDSALSKAAGAAVAFGAAGAAAVTAFTAASVNTYKEFQSSMSNVAGIKNIAVGSDEYKKLEQAARDAGKSTTKTAQESADALSYMALAGWSTEDSIKGLEPILRASEATGADLATTSDLITDSMSAMGIGVDGLTEYLDVCAAAQNNSNTTLTELQEAFINCGATLNSFNTDSKEGAALLGVLANRGLKGSEAGNSLQSVLVNLTKKTGESYKAMQALGVSAYDTSGNFRSITEVLEDVNEATKDLTEEQRNNYLTMIGGKTQLTTLQDLMAGLNNLNEKGISELEELYDTVDDSDGALDRMADTMTDNLSGALALAQSATQDLQIELGAKLEPYITQAVRWFSSLLPEATEKFGTWIDTKLPAAINVGKSALSTLQSVLSFVTEHFRGIAAAAVSVVAGLKGFTILNSVAQVVAKFSSIRKDLTAGAKLIATLKTAFNVSGLTLALGGVAAGIAAVVAGLALYKAHCDKLKAEDLAEHFGDITLSAEECSKIVRNVFGDEICEQVDRVNYAMGDLSSAIETVNSDVHKMNKLNYKLEFGGGVSPEEYQQEYESYMADIQELADSQQYSIKVSLDLLFGEGSEDENALQGLIDPLFENNRSELEQLGGEIGDVISEAINNNTEIDPEQIKEQLRRIEEIKQEFQLEQSQAQLEMAKRDFTSSDLSADSFKLLQQTTDEQLEVMDEAISNSVTQGIAAATYAWNKAIEARDNGDSTLYNAFINTYGRPEHLGETTLDKVIDDIYNAGNQQKLEQYTKAGNFITDTFYEAYGDELSTAHGYMTSTDIGNFAGYDPTRERISNKLSRINSGEEDVSNSFLKEYQNAVDSSYDAMGKATRDNISDIYNSYTKDFADKFSSLMSKSDVVPQETVDAFLGLSEIGAIAGDKNSLRQVTVSRLTDRLSDDQDLIIKDSSYSAEYFKGIARGYAKGADDGAAEVRPQMEQSGQAITDSYNKGMEAGANTVNSTAAATSEKAANTLSTATGAQANKIQTGGKKQAENLGTGIKAAESGLVGQVDDTKNVIANEFEAPIDVTTQVNATLTAGDIDASGFKNHAQSTIQNILNGVSISVNSDSDTETHIMGPVQQKATGTTYFGGGWTTINENGPELVNLPTGTSVIPADKTRKLLGGGSNISLTVNVNGNVYGEEDAINRIGNGILEQVYDAIQAM